MRLSGLRAQVHAWWKLLLGEHTSPGRLAAAVLVGAIVGCSPFFGLHLPLCIGLAYVLRLNQITVYAAANVSIPPAAPFLGYASVALGERLLHQRWLPFGLVEFRHAPLLKTAGRYFVNWIVGGLILGTAIGLVLGAIVYVIARRRRKRALAADPVDKAIKQAAARYRVVPNKTLRFYAWCKYRLDPCYRAIAEIIPDGTLTVDLGTGLGMLPLLLGVLPGQRRALGVDWDEPKLEAGRLAARDLERVRLERGDLRTWSIPACDVITLVDVLHYYAPEVQREILERCAGALRDNGMILVREGDAGRQRGSRWTRFIEELAVRLGWNRGEGKTKFRSVEEFRAELETLGFAVETNAVAGKLHPGNVLIVGRRKASVIAESLG